jgi:serine/threonine protein phosphatase PrpC
MSDPQVNVESRRSFAQQIRVFSRTDVGKRRQRNEDSLGVIPRHGIYVVADGMGGVDGGDYASKRVVDDLVERFQDMDPGTLNFDERIDLICETINASSAGIRDEARNRDICGMGTTVVVLCIDVKNPGRACALHVGDSRVYQFRRNTLRALTIDHSLAAESGLENSAAIPLFMAGVITRAVGVKEEVEVERTPVRVLPGDRFMLCSDGLYNMIPEPELTSIFIDDHEDISSELISAANHAGGFDNITVIVLKVPGDSPDVNPLDDTIT